MKFFFGTLNLSKKTHDNSMANFQADQFNTNVSSISNKYLNLKFSENDSNSYHEDEEAIFFIFGRINNFSSLASTFLDIRISSHAHLLKCLYQRYKKDFIHKISGPFSIIIYVKKTRSFNCYRDHIGLRPFYFFVDKKTVYICSDLCELAKLKNYRKTINKNRVVCFLTHTCGHRSETFYEKIYKIPSSSSVLFVDEQFTFIEYEYLIPDKDKLSYEGYRLRLKQKLEDAVLNECSNKNYFAAKLSGGLDSSSIGGLLVSSAKANVSFYSVVYEFSDDKSFNIVDEMHYMKSFEDMYKLKSQKVIIKENDRVSPFLFDHNDPEPNFIVNRYFDIRILQEVSKSKHKIIFDGFDGDSVITYGINYLYDLGRSLRIKDLIKHKRHLEKTGSKKKGGSFNFFFKYLIMPFLPVFIINLLNKIRGKKDSERIGYDMLDRNVQKSFPLNEINKKFNIKKSNYLHSWKVHKKVLKWPIWEQILEINFSDSNKFGVEEVFPFLDKKLMNVSLNTPARYKLMNGYKRFILRDAMREFIPKEVFSRSNKSDLSPSIVAYFANLKKEKSYYELLLGKKSPLKGLINENKVKEFYSRNQRSDNQQLMKLISLARWMERNNFKWN